MANRLRKNKMTVTREETQEKLDKIAAAAVTHKPDQSYTVADRYEEHAQNNADHPYLIYEDQVFSFAEVNRQANRIAHVIHNMGMECGDTIAVMLENRPEFFFITAGLAKLGITAALINTNTKDKALAHAIATTKSCLLIAGSECLDQILQTQELTELGLKIIILNNPVFTDKKCHDYTILDGLLSQANDCNPPKEWRNGLNASHDLFNVFTSGTTGLPKAAHLSHMRWLNTGEANSIVLQSTPNDIFYCFLPLYHSAAGMSLVAAAFASGATILVRRRFSAREFWHDVHKHGVTICQYIGEICRYLINQPELPDDADNSLDRIIGAGLTPTVWKKFQRRFGIRHVHEGWGATEANCGILNLDNKLGSCGRIPYFDKSNIRLIRYNTDREEYLRDKNGHMIACRPGEVGEVIGMIMNIPGVGAGRFEGYICKDATEKKILRNVFKEGDAWFRSGDLLRYDDGGYFYFVDRIGDTFRWKSENVSTAEVTETLGDYPGFETINVYGVKVPETEGRAGMAAFVLSEGGAFDPKAFHCFVTDNLPPYAVPLFIRISDQTELTTTFKLRKLNLQKQGYSPELIPDPLYVLDGDERTYSPLTDTTLTRLGIPAFVAE